MSKLPDFIIIGAMKSATSTLQEQLSLQPGVFMCSPKEPNFFSDDKQYCKGMAWYSGLFSQAPENRLLGEASTHYTKLPTHPRTVSRLQSALPGARFIYVMRHPVDRLISHYLHEWSMGVYRCSIEDAIQNHPELIAYGQYGLQLEPFFAAYGRAAVLPVFFDQLTHNPQAELERICDFIGYDGKPTWQDDLEPSNVSSKRIRRFPLYAFLVESGIATWLRRRLIPQRVRDAVKARLTKRHRPVLSNEALAQLEEVFNRDMARVGGWLGVELNCSNFKAVTTGKPLNWAQPDAK